MTNIQEMVLPEVAPGIGSEGHDLEGDFSMISRTTSVVTSLNFANKQLIGCMVLAVHLGAGQFSVDCLKFAVLLIKKALNLSVRFCIEMWDG